MKNNLECVLTTNKREIREYQELRSDIFKNELGWNIDEEKAKAFDKNGYIFVLKKDNEVIGGARVMLSKDMNMMSNECTDFNYIKLLRNNNLHKDNYIEVEGAILDIKNRNNFQKVIKRIIIYGKTLNYNYIINIQNAIGCRLYKLEVSKLGYKSIFNKDNLWSSLPEYNYSQDYALITLL